jgi:hypothetical protein
MSMQLRSPAERGRAGVLARLAAEDHHEMTAAANASTSHPGRLARWVELAREKDPSLDDGQAAERAEQLRTAHYRELGYRSAQSRRARWVRLALEEDPSLDDGQAAERAEQLRTAHYRELNRRAAQRRRARGDNQ